MQSPKDNQSQPPLPHVWMVPRRVPVSKSMLYAYSEMRGNKDIQEIHGLWHGPLYPGLFHHPRGHPGEWAPAWIPGMTDEQFENLPTNIAWFWEPIEPVISPYQPPQADPSLVQDTDQGMTFSEYTKEQPPRFRPNHYYGSEVYGNYNYIKVNGSWVDPDSEGEVFDALTNRVDLTQPPCLPVGKDGPRVMSVEEVDMFYRGYVEEVWDIEDREGDPRNLRISPATFAHWAAGASKGDSYVEKTGLTPERPRMGRSKTNPWNIKTPRLHRRPQFDVETGSILSGVYEPERDPSIIFSGQGVDESQRPVNYARMNPQGDQDLNRATFGPPIDEEKIMERTQEWIASSTASIFRDKNTMNMLASPDDLPAARTQMYNERKERLDRLKNEHQRGLSQNLDRYVNIIEVEAKGAQIHREVFIMQNHLDKKAGPRRKTKEVSSVDHSSAPTPTVITPMAESRKRRYTRHVRDMEEREEMGIARTREVNIRLDAELKMVLDGMHNLASIHDGLRQDCGVETSEEIESLLSKGRDKKKGGNQEHDCKHTDTGDLEVGDSTVNAR